MTKRGRPRRTDVASLRAKAWVQESLRLGGFASLYQMRHAVFGVQAEQTRYFERIAKGTYSPGAVLLRLTEQVIPGSKQVFEVGPMEEGRAVPLWQALEGPIEDMWAVLDWFSPAYKRSRLFGFTQQHRIDYLVRHLTGERLSFADLAHGRPLTGLLDRGMGALEAPAGPLSPADLETFEHWIDVYRPPVDENMVDWEHPVARLLIEGAIAPTLGGLAATVALWRLSHFLGECWREMDDLMRGLLVAPRRKALRDAGGLVERDSDGSVSTIPSSSAGSYAAALLEPLDIEEEFLRFIRAKWMLSAKNYAAVVHTLRVDRE